MKAAGAGLATDGTPRRRGTTTQAKGCLRAWVQGTEDCGQPPRLPPQLAHGLPAAPSIWAPTHSGPSCVHHTPRSGQDQAPAPLQLPFPPLTHGPTGQPWARRSSWHTCPGCWPAEHQAFLYLPLQPWPQSPPCSLFSRPLESLAWFHISISCPAAPCPATFPPHGSMGRWADTLDLTFPTPPSWPSAPTCSARLRHISEGDSPSCWGSCLALSLDLPRTPRPCLATPSLPWWLCHQYTHLDRCGHLGSGPLLLRLLPTGDPRSLRQAHVPPLLKMLLCSIFLS